MQVQMLFKMQFFGSPSARQFNSYYLRWDPCVYGGKLTFKPQYQHVYSLLAPSYVPYGTTWENYFKCQDIFSLVISSSIPVTMTNDTGGRN